MGAEKRDFTIEALVGERLVSVQFLREAVVFHFDNLSLVAYRWPIVVLEGRSLTFGQAGYCDTLRLLIASQVLKAPVIEAGSLRLAFTNAAVIDIPLVKRKSEGAELFERSSGRTLAVW